MSVMYIPPKKGQIVKVNLLIKKNVVHEEKETHYFDGLYYDTHGLSTTHARKIVINHSDNCQFLHNNEIYLH